MLTGGPTFTADKGIVYSMAPPFDNLWLYGEMTFLTFECGACQKPIPNTQLRPGSYFRPGTAQIATSDSNNSQENEECRQQRSK
jgi:hypothetical protein